MTLRNNKALPFILTCPGSPKCKIFIKYQNKRIIFPSSLNRITLKKKKLPALLLRNKFPIQTHLCNRMLSIKAYCCWKLIKGSCMPFLLHTCRAHLGWEVGEDGVSSKKLSWIPNNGIKLWGCRLEIRRKQKVTFFLFWGQRLMQPPLAPTPSAATSQELAGL